MCARSWHNRCASFVSCAESDMVHRDLSPDKMCQCHTLPFVAGVYLKGAQSFLEATVTQINMCVSLGVHLHAWHLCRNAGHLFRI